MDDRTIAELAKLLGGAEPKRVYEIGSRNVNGTARCLLRTPAQYHGIDLVGGRDVDVVADGLTYDPPFVPDCVVCCEVLEHTPHAAQLVKRMVDVAAPGGLILISCAGPERILHSIDGTPLTNGEYYGGITPDDLGRWLLESGAHEVKLTLGVVPEAIRVLDKPDGVHDIYALARKPRQFAVPTVKRERLKVPGVQPQTVVHDNLRTTFEELAERVLQTRKDHGDVLQAFHDIWYTCGHTWVFTHFLGVSVMKNPNDLWVYQALMTALRPQCVIETGTYQGGSALWFAYLMDMLGIVGGKVYTIDFEDHVTMPPPRHPRITWLAADSTDPAVVEAIAAEKPAGPLLVSLDADHTAEHVGKELALYAPLCAVGDWLVVEDTDIAWHPQEGVDGQLYPGDHGARGGVQAYLEQHPGEWRQDVLCERYLLTCHPGGWLQRIKACEHDA